MKRTLFGIAAVVLALGLILTGCTGPVDPISVAGARASNNGNGNNGNGNGNNGNNGNSGNGNGNASSGGAGTAIYLKGSGNQFAWAGWQNIFYTGGASAADNKAELNGWHLVYSGKVFNAVTYMQITFTNGEKFVWTPDMGPSVNGGGNNMGWIIYAPAGWEIAYIDKGNNNQSESFLTTTENGNPQFNISGFNKGKAPPPLPPPVKGKIRFEKIVEGELISAWVKGGKITDYLTGFNLYYANDKGEQGAFKEFKALGSDSSVLFENLDNGWYAVEEVKGPKFAEAFVDSGLKYFQVVNGVAYGLSSEFDYDAQFKILNGWGSGYVLGYGNNSDLLNNSGDIFPIGIFDVATGQEYASFCANGGSENFSSGYYTVNRNLDYGMAPLADFIAAYNYINDIYGDLDDYRPVTQIVTWYLLGKIDIASEEFENINWAAVKAGGSRVKGVEGAKDIVLDVIANYSGYAGKGDIVDVVFLTDPNDNSDRIQAQPQLVPVKGQRVFKNIVLPPPEKFSVSFTKAKYDGAWPVDAGEFDFDLFKMNAAGEYELYGTYSTAAGGLVSASDLAPGKYYFKEAWAIYQTPNGAEIWAFAWDDGNDEGLFFEITDRDLNLDVGGRPAATNTMYCKHNVRFVTILSGTEKDYDTIYNDDGSIAGYILMGGACDGHLIADYRPATCNTSAVIWFTCENAGNGICDAMKFNVIISAPLGHGHDLGFEYTIANAAAGTVWVRCLDCGQNSLQTLLAQGYVIPEGAIQNPNNANNLYWPEKVAELLAK